MHKAICKRIDKDYTTIMKWMNLPSMRNILHSKIYVTVSKKLHMMRSLTYKRSNRMKNAFLIVAKLAQIFQYC